MEHEIEEEPEQWYKGPIRWILTIFLLLLLVSWVFANYAVKVDHNPDYIPYINEVVGEFEIENRTTNDYLSLVKPYDPVVKQTADKIISLSGCSGSKVCQAKAIFYFVRDRFDYVSDPLQFEYIKGARESLSSHNGDCDDSSVLAANLLQAIGIRTRFVFVPNHVYVEAHLPDALKRYKSELDWVPIDLTCKSCEFGEVSWKYTGVERRYLE